MAEEHLEQQISELRLLNSVTEKINAGVKLEEVLEEVFRTFHVLIPYERIGFSLLSEHAGQTMVSAWWAKSLAAEIQLGKDYSVPLETTSLGTVLNSRTPRILNDLPAYLAEKPNSDSTSRVVKEGMQSSLTCPLMVRGKALGFLFFSCTRKQAYHDGHVDLFLQLAGQLALILDKSRLHDDLVRINDLKNTFIGMLAHDLRNPLAVIISYVDLYKTGLVGREENELNDLFDRIGGSADRMLSLIADALDVSVIESSTFNLEPKPVHMGFFLANCASGYELLARKKNIALAMEADPALSMAVFDANRIEQVLSNLITNAIKFSNSGSTITLRARSAPGEVIFEVADQGLGIPENELPRIFNPFARTSVRPTANEKSTGLGLAIVKKLVQAHRGRIEVQSSPGRGTTITIYLPQPS